MMKNHTLLLFSMFILLILPGTHPLADTRDLPNWNVTVKNLKDVSTEEIENTLVVSVPETTAGNPYVRAVYKPTFTLSRRVTADSIFDVFNAAEEIVLSLLEGFNNTHIGYGNTNPSGRGCIGFWENYSHTIEWIVDIPESAYYKTILRYSHDGKISDRDLKSDSLYPADAFKNFNLPGTGGWSQNTDDWEYYPVPDNKSDITVYIEKGKHSISMKTTGGIKSQGITGVNLDFIAFLSTDLDLAALECFLKNSR